MISFIYDFIYAFPIYLVTLILMADFFQIPGEGKVFYLLSVLMMGIVTGLKNLTNSMKLLLVGIVLAISAGVILVHKPDERLLYISDHQWLGWMLLTAIVVFVISKIIEEFKAVRLLAAVVLIFTAVAQLLNYIPENRVIVTFIFFELLLFVIENVQASWIKSGDKDNKKHLVLVTPAVVVICVIISVVPVSKEPYRWGFVKSIGNRIVEIAKFTTRFLPGNGDDYVDVGFSDSSVFSEIVQPNPREIMELSAGKDAGKTIYLSGKTFNEFENKEWKSTYVSDSHEHLMDNLETLCAVYAYEPEHTADYIKPAKLTFKYKVFNTKYIFVPQKADLSERTLYDVAYTDRSDAVIADKNLGYGTTYAVKFYQLNKDNEEFGNFVKESQGFGEDIWNYKRGRLSDCTFEEYKRYKDNIYSQYLSNVEVSGELQEILDELYDGAESKWDKMKRLEAMLSTFKYSNEPGKIPDSVQDERAYLDYFILEKREGYCVHFATTFVLLARAEGLPARFVQGYLANRQGAEDIMMKSNMAHAWAEVYFENVGWIIFEATPGYYSPVSWKIKDHDESGDYEQNYGPEFYEELRDKYANQSETEDEMEGNDESRDDEKKEPVNVWMIIIPVSLGIVFAALFMLLYSYSVNKRYRALDDEQRAKLLCRMNMYILNIIGYVMDSGETLEEFCKKLNDVLSKDILLFIKYYEELTYSDKGCSDEMLSEIEASNKKLLEELSNRKRHMAVFYKLKLSFKLSTLL